MFQTVPTSSELLAFTVCGIPGRRYGVYSETPDLMPLVGEPADSPGVCYIVGCNAWGQASVPHAGGW